jgi:hypothetical protein
LLAARFGGDDNDAAMPPIAETFRPVSRSECTSNRRRLSVADLSNIMEHAEIIGADGVHVGKVDRVEGDRIKLTKQDSGEGRHYGHHHYVPGSLVAAVEGGTVRLSANANVAVMFEEEQ